MKVGPPLGVPLPLQPVLGGKGDERAAGGFEELLEALSLAEMPATPAAIHRAPEILPEIGSLPQQFQDASLAVEIALDLGQSNGLYVGPSQPARSGHVETAFAAIRQLLESAHRDQSDAVRRRRPIAIDAVELAAPPALRAVASVPHNDPNVARPRMQVARLAASAPPPQPIASEATPLRTAPREPTKPADSVHLHLPPGESMRAAERIGGLPPTTENWQPVLRSATPQHQRQPATPAQQSTDIAPSKPVTAGYVEPKTASLKAPRPAPPPAQSASAKPAANRDPALAGPDSGQAMFSAQLQAAEGGVRVILRLPRLTEAERGELAARIGQLLDGFGHRRREIVIQENGTV
jgi:hypothetical protein